MRRCNYVTFNSDLPDDSEESPTGDIVKPRGYNVAVVLREILDDQGLIASNVEQLEDYGWEFILEDKGTKVLFILQEYLGPPSLQLGCRDITSLSRRLLGVQSATKYHLIVESLSKSLRQDNRFRNIQWFTEEEFCKHYSPEGGGQAP